MDNRAKKLLFDVLVSGRSIREWCEECSFPEYERDRQFRRAVEREFEIIGEALNRLTQADPTTAARIEGLNRIIHGYDAVDDATVWRVVASHLPRLIVEVEALLREAGESV